jgi:beta-xylosidase
VGLKPLFASLALLVAAPVAAQHTPAQAPLLLPQMQLHDPFIVADKSSRTYYLFTRNEAAMTGERRLGTMVYASKDLKHWTRPRVAFTLPEGIWAKAGAWAPEVHPWKGKWYLFTTFHDEAATLPATGSRKPYRRGTILAVADKIEGPYRVVRNGEPIAPKALMTLDGTLHVDAAGKPWLVYAHEWLQTTIGTIEAMTSLQRANRACCSAPTKRIGRGASVKRMATPSG